MKWVNLKSSTNPPLSFDYRKIIKGFMGNFTKFYITDYCAWTSVNHGDKFFKDHRFSGSIDLDPAVREIDNCSGNVEVCCDFFHTSTKSDFLDPSADEEFNRFHSRYNPCMTFIARPNSSNTSSLNVDWRIFVAASIA